MFCTKLSRIPKQNFKRVSTPNKIVLFETFDCIQLFFYFLSIFYCIKQISDSSLIRVISIYYDKGIYILLYDYFFHV